MQASWILYNLKERIYKRYVLRRIEAAVAGESTFSWTPPDFGRNGRANDWPQELHTRLQKWILLLDDENDFLFGPELHQDKVSIIRVPATSCKDVLHVVRHIFPGKETERIYFWFGTRYMNNGNNDFGALITEACHHFSSHLGRIHQYVVLPPYNRHQPDAWSFDVLSLYLQREQLLPHARVILHPYDVTLWYNDQTKFQQLGELPPWTDRFQSANGTINNWSTVEARKYNMREWHDSDLWTWYKKDARAKPPPPSIGARIGRDGQVVKDRSADATPTNEVQDEPGAFGPLPTRQRESATRPDSLDDSPSTSADATTMPTANVSGSGPLPIQHARP